MSRPRSAAAVRLTSAAPVFAALGDPTRLRLVARLCADEWPIDSRVRAARIALNGGKTWTAMSEAERLGYTLRIAYGSMAYAVLSAPPTLTAEPTSLKRVLDFVDRLERQAERIGKAGAPVMADGWTAFLEQVKTDQRLAEALKAPGREKRVQGTPTIMFRTGHLLTVRPPASSPTRDPAGRR